MRFKLSPDAKSYLDRQDNDTVKRVYDALRKITKNPPQGDVKQLQGRKGYRLRVGDMRILFTIEGNNVNIDAIAPRG